MFGENNEPCTKADAISFKARLNGMNGIAETVFITPETGNIT